MSINQCSWCFECRKHGRLSCPADTFLCSRRCVSRVAFHCLHLSTAPAVPGTESSVPFSRRRIFAPVNPGRVRASRKSLTIFLCPQSCASPISLVDDDDVNAKRPVRPVYQCHFYISCSRRARYKIHLPGKIANFLAKQVPGILHALDDTRC
jgi:hypothetical protein